jgi:hypothetical protein
MKGVKHAVRRDKNGKGKLKQRRHKVSDFKKTEESLSEKGKLKEVNKEISKNKQR